MKVKAGTTASRDFRLVQKNGKAVKLTTDDEVFYLQQPREAEEDAPVNIEIECAIINAGQAVVRLIPGDAWEVPGLYDAEFEIRYEDGAEDTVPDGEYMPVEVVQDLN